MISESVLIISILAAALLGLIVTTSWAMYKVSGLKTLLERERKNSQKIIHQKKSSEVRLGKVAENMAPFFSDWPYDPNRFRFLGNPIDGISFNDNEVVFVEIKSGGARLSKTQKHVKDLVKQGKVRFVSFKVTDTGTQVKLEADMENND